MNILNAPDLLIGSDAHVNFQITAKTMHVITVLTPLLADTEWWPRRGDVAWYVGRCIAAGFCGTDDLIRLCAQRFMAGKRRVTPPGTRRNKESEKAKRKLSRCMPYQLNDAIAEAIESDAGQEYANGNDRAINAVVGQVLRKYKADPSFVREEIARRMKK